MNTPSVTLGQPDLATSQLPLLGIALAAKATLPTALQSLDSAMGGAIERALETRDFRGARDEVLYLSGATGPRRVLLVGTGDSTTPLAVQRAAAIVARHAQKLGSGSAAFHAEGLQGATLEGAAVGFFKGAWQFLDTKTLPPEDQRRAPLQSVVLLADSTPGNRRALDAGIAVGIGQSLARRLAMMPGNIATPDLLADAARAVAERHGMRYRSLGRAELEAEQMGAFLCVAQGTPQEPRLVALEYGGGAAGDKPIVLVGKGLCFDSGGISIKPAQGMELMKFDMSGAAGVIGALEAIGRLQLPVNVVGIFGATTNMPSGTAVKPGDVVRSQLGKYIEIVNTDAEGRLVLADLLSYARRFDPAVVIDAATLTGAAVIALGHSASLVFGPDQALVDEVMRAGERSGERLWPLPLWDEFRDLITSDVADIKNSGGRPAGCITAAMFLREFTESYPWIHLDIAGTAYSESDLVAIPKGPTGVPVGVFVEFVRARAGR